MFEKKDNIGLTFVNYNYAFNNFYESYKNLCLKISEKSKLSDLKDIRKNIATFIYEYDYTINNPLDRVLYNTELQRIKDKADKDEELKKILNKDNSIVDNIVIYYNKYYEYFLDYLRVLGSFVSRLTSTFMPNTNIQKKLIRFSNNQAFFEKFTEHKSAIILTLSDFTIYDFVRNYNNLITFYYAYNLFINKEDRVLIEELFSIILSIYLNRDNLRLLATELTQMQRDKILANESLIHNSLNYINSKMNQNFSNFDVLPKLQEKIYIDRTLI